MQSTLTLEFTLEEINGILALLGRLPFADSNNAIRLIVDKAQPQADAIVAAEEAKATTE